MKELLGNRKGMALLLVVGLVSVMAIVTLQFSRDMRQDYVSSAGLRDSVRMEVMAESGVTLAKEILLKDQVDNSFDSLYDSWALLAEEDFSSLFPQGKMELAVYDETGKFPINAMVIRKKQGQVAVDNTNENQTVQHEIDVRNVLWRLLRAEPFLVEDGDARAIIDSLIDWMDGGDGDGEEEYGAEDSYYRSLDPPYSCKNGPVESIEELLLVKGITRELLYGTEERPPLAPLLTTWGVAGKININTADSLILAALSEGMDKETAEAMVSFREDENNQDLLALPTWYKNVPSFPGDIELKKDLISTKSSYFSVEATAGFDDRQKSVTAIIQRREEELSLLRWESD